MTFDIAVVADCLCCEGLISLAVVLLLQFLQEVSTRFGETVQLTLSLLLLDSWIGEMLSEQFRHRGYMLLHLVNCHPAYSRAGGRELSCLSDGSPAVLSESLKVKLLTTRGLRLGRAGVGGVTLAYSDLIAIRCCRSVRARSCTLAPKPYQI